MGYLSLFRPYRFLNVSINQIELITTQTDQPLPRQAKSIKVLINVSDFASMII